MKILTEGGTAVLHPSGSCVVLTPAIGQPALMLPCDLMDELVIEGRVRLVGEEYVLVS